MDEHTTATDRPMTAPRTLEYIKNNDGCTFAIVGDIPTLEIEDFSAHTSGEAYAVAMFHGDDLRIKNYLVCDDDLLHMIIRSFTRWAKDQSPTAYFGAWVDGDDLVLDASRVSYDREIAVELAQELEQDAIFDLINFREIFYFPAIDSWGYIIRWGDSQ